MAGAPRKQIDKAEFIRLAVAGTKVAAIASALGVSLGTAKRRWDEWEEDIRQTRQATLLVAGGLPPESSTDVPAEATLDQIDEWLAVAKRKANDAALLGDEEAHLGYMRLIISLLEARRKAEPEKPKDPNENPDFIAAATRVRERWHKLAESLVRVANSPLAEMLTSKAKS
jgi:hypothetical protein